MRKIFILFMLLILSGCAKKDLITELHLSLENKDYSNAKELFAKNKYKFNKRDYLYFSGIIQNAFNENEKSIDSLHQLVEECTDLLPDSLMAKTLLYQFDNYQKTLELKKVQSTAELILKKYKTFCDSLELSEINKHLN